MPRKHGQMGADLSAMGAARNYFAANTCYTGKNPGRRWRRRGVGFAESRKILCQSKALDGCGTPPGALPADPGSQARMEPRELASGPGQLGDRADPAQAAGTSRTGVAPRPANS